MVAQGGSSYRPVPTRRSALRQRVRTGLSLGAVAIAAILLLPTPILALAMGVATLLGAWEWARLTGCRSGIAQAGYVGTVGGSALAAAWATLSLGQLWPLFIGGCWWLGVVLLNTLYRPTWATPTLWRQWLLRLAGLVTLVPAWTAIVTLHGLAPIWLLFCLLLTSAADIAAFFAGRYYGHTPLAPRLSPGKTREGLFGALLACATLGLIGACCAALPLAAWGPFIGLCLLTALVSVEGDLFESLLKRQAGVKDSGNLLPGHGGVLDRIDSVTAAAPIFYLGLVWILP